MQRDRLQERNAARAVALPMTTSDAWSFVDLTGEPGHDLDYYVYEMGRLQDLAREVCKVYGKPKRLVEALETFDQAIPSLRQARNPLTHPSDDDRLDKVGFSGAVVRYGSAGRVDYLVDPRYRHHEAAEALARELLEFLGDRTEEDLPGSNS